VVKAIRRFTTKRLDCHLMIEPADPYVAAFAAAGADLITVHVEACPHLDRTLQAIRDLGKLAGVALNPATSETTIEYVLDKLDLILAMTVNPGFGGQAFLPANLEKIRRLRTMTAGLDVLIEVDGGINTRTASLVVEAGAEVLVAGSAIFDQADYARAIAALRAPLEA